MFVWSKKFELGIPIIDEQHQEFLKIGNKLFHLLAGHQEEASYDDILRVLAELEAYTIYHFNTEESLLLSINYPHFASHKAEHDAFITYLKDVDLEKMEGQEQVFLNELLRKVIDWLFQHIKTADFLYQPYVNNKC